MARKRQKSGVVFCPFCREAFEDVETCPEHELRLVPLAELATSDAAAEPEDDDVLPLYEVRHGRGIAMLGALATLAGFFLPAVWRAGEPAVEASAYALARTLAPSLWTTPFAALSVLGILARRRTMRSMRGVRLLVPCMALFPALAVAIAIGRTLRGAREQSALTGAEIDVGAAWGAWVVFAGCALIIAGGAMLGVRRTNDGR